MNDEKKEILSKLYCIKAGLSAISIEKEKVVKEEKNLITSQNDIKKNREDYNHSSELVTQYRTEMVKLENQQEEYKNKKIGKPGIPPIIGLALSFALLACILSPIGLLIYCFIHDLVMSIKSGGGESVVTIESTMKHTGTVVLIAASITFVVSFIILYVLELKEQKNTRYSFNKSYDDKIKENKEKLEVENYAMNKLSDENIKLKEKYDTNLVTYQKVKDVSVPTSKDLYNALYKEYNSIVDARDWKHLDLIIFYYETGRADTLKEALQQVDRQVQTNEIIKAIDKASKDICNTIRQSMQQLSNQMTSCFNQLSVQLNVQHQETMAQLKNINSNIATLNENVNSLKDTIKDGNAILEDLSSNMSKISNATYLQNALLEKISTGSMSLDKDTTFMINYNVPKEISSIDISKYAIKDKNTLDNKN